MVSMGEAFKLFWKRYVDFTGKSTRAEYWWMALWAFIVYTVLGLLLLIAGGGTVWAAFSNPAEAGQIFSAAAGAAVVMVIIGVLMFLLTLAVLVPTIALLIRRFRDAGLATWAAWTVFGVNVLFNVVVETNNGFVNFLVSIWGILIFVIVLLPTNALSSINGIGNGDK